MHSIARENLLESQDHWLIIKITRQQKVVNLFCTLGPIALQGIMEKEGYMHFLIFHAAIRALCHSPTSQTLLFFAKLALEKFVEICQKLYKHTFFSYNVHALLHLSTDVERLGPLDSFSVFPYENNISFFRKYYRKSHRPLQQFFNREADKEK